MWDVATVHRGDRELLGRVHADPDSWGAQRLTMVEPFGATFEVDELLKP
jgi:hypothetical protein